MRPRPPRSTLRPALVAVALALLVASSSIAASGLTTSVAPGGSIGLHSQGAAATCTTGTAASGLSSPASDNLSVSTWTAPASAAGEFQTGVAVEDAIDTGRLTPAYAGENRYEKDAVAVGDVVVHRIRLNGSATGLLDRLEAQGGGSTTENFRRLVHADNGIDLHYLGPTACPPRLALNESIEDGAFRVVTHHERDELYLVVDVEELSFELGDSGPVAEKWNWGHHQITVVLDETSGLASGETVVHDHYEVDRRWVEFETEHDSLVRFTPESNQTVTGSASMAPGTALELELVPLGNPNATAAHTTTTTLDRDGQFTATFDLVDAPDSGLYTIRTPETPRADPPRRLVVVGNATGASIGATDHESIGTVLYANGVTTTDGGFIVARNDTTTVAVSEYFGPGAATPQPEYDPLLWQNETLTITVYKDSDGDRTFDPAVDEPYRLAGDPVQTTVNVTVDVSERETTTQTTSHPTTTTTSTPTTATSTTQDTTESTATTTGGSGETSQGSDTRVRTPGFGGLAALLALLIGALLARRR